MFQAKNWKNSKVLDKVSIKLWAMHTDTGCKKSFLFMTPITIKLKIQLDKYILVGSFFFYLLHPDSNIKAEIKMY